MDTTTFLELILPTEGYALIAVKTDKGFRHRGFKSAGAAADFALECDAKGLETYFACSAYKDRPHKGPDGKFIARTSTNWLKAKAFWVDVDCGADKATKGVGYATQTEGAVAILQWCRDNGVPYPMVVSSGRGIHVYWCLEDAVEPSRWYPAACALKEALKVGGILSDATRTSDFASVLRPVGTHNHKDPSNPLPVALVRAQKHPVSFDTLNEKFSELGGVFAAPAWLSDEPVESFSLHDEIEASAELVADKCKAVAVMRDTQGDVSYDHWRGVIGLVKFCTEGVELAKKWSERRAETGHTNVDVETRYESWNTGPTSCEFFAQCSDGACADCPHKGNIKTPLVLGRVLPEPASEQVAVTLEDDTKQNEVQVEVPELPSGYSWNGQVMVRYVENKEGVLQAQSFCKVRFYLVDRIRNDSGQFEFLVRAHLPKGVLREFILDGGIIGTGGTKLLEKLGGYEIFAMSTQTAAANLHAYLKDSVTKLTETRSVTSTFTHFGWQDDGSFLIGNRLYRPDGTTVISLLSGHAAKSADTFPRPRGSVEGYAEGINWVYNRDGMEPMQYLICSLWAAPLVDLCEATYNGIPCAVTGAESGKGKSTAALAALYAYGEPFPNLCIAGKEGATAKAQAAFVGTLRNLPVLFDEVTNKSSAQLSDICYALSNGVENMRLRSAGGRVEFGDREAWRTQVAMTANTHIGARLAEGGNTEAEAMRIFEIRVDSYDIPKLDPMAVTSAVTALSENVGSAGEAIVKYIVEHRSEVQAMMRDTYQLISHNKDLMQQPKYRFYRNHMACTLTMCRIANQLGIAAFSPEKLATFAEDAVRRIFEETQATNELTSEAALAQMLTELGPRIITTLTYDRIGDNFRPYEVACYQGIVGRSIRGSENFKDPVYDQKMILSAKAVVDWCSRNRVDRTRFANELTDMGILLDRRAFIAMGKCTSVTIPRQRCWILDLNKLDESGTNDE